MKNNKLSVVFVTLNRGNKIGLALESVKWADEIIVLDGESRDNTKQICKQYTDKFFLQPKGLLEKANWNIDAVKNIGFDMASGGWILSLDSDEIVSEELANEIRRTLASHSDFSAFLIPRKNYYWGKYVRVLEPDYQLRLFKRGKGRFEGRHVHERLKVDGQIGTFKNGILHSNYDSVIDFFRRALFYSRNEISIMQSKNEAKKIHRLFTYPFHDFRFYFIKQKAYKDGFSGLIVSLLYASYRTIIYLRYLLICKIK